MSEVQSIYDAIKKSSGQIRQDRLVHLSQELVASTTTAEDLLLGLRQTTNDVRKIVLDTVSTRSNSALLAKTLITTILDILRQSLCASSTSLSAIRTASSALKSLSSLFKPHGTNAVCPLNPLEMQSLVEVILATMAWGLITFSFRASITTTHNKQRRIGPGSAFAFDRREESQVSTWRRSNVPPSTAISLVKKSSTTSLSSLHGETSTSASSTAAGFETDHSAASDGEGGDDSEKREKRMREARRGVRYRSILCLSLLIEHYAKLLLIHWPRLLLNAEGGTRAASLMDVVERDESLSNRIAAIHTVQTTITLGSQAGFMAGAEEGSRVSAFTSLSSRIASMIVDLRRRLLIILMDTSTPLSLLEATLKCTRALVISTPKVKLRASHSQVLRETTLKLCSQSETASAVPAYSLLSALVAGDKEGERDAVAGGSILATLQDQTLLLKVRIEAWNTMTTLAEKRAISDENVVSLGPLIQFAISDQSPLELRQAAASFIQACLSKGSSIPVNDDDDVLEQLCNDSSAIIRSMAANCLASDLGKESQLQLLLDDNDSTVRASAVRAIGVKIQSEGRCILDHEIFRLVCDDSLLVRMRASWSLGNLCEVGENYADLLEQCYSLKDEDERVSVNAIRGTGALLARCTLTKVQQNQDSIESILTWLYTAISCGGPKIRWNASACLARSLTLPSTCHQIASLHQHRLAFVLAKVIVEDDTFKVRLSAVQALLTLTERKNLGTLEVATAVRKAVHEAVGKVEDQVKQASFREAQLHAIPLQQSLGRLSELLQSQYPS